MPARKPRSLITRDETKDDRDRRASAEQALTPTTQLSRRAPAALKKHAHAAETWKQLVSLYFETEGTIVTAFDAGLLVKYCLADEELLELTELRNEIKEMWKTHAKWLKNLKPKADQLKDYFGALSQANALLQRFQGMDARLDGKRKYILSLEQSLYLTPRSRAGVAPPEKEPENDDDPMANLLGESD